MDHEDLPFAELKANILGMGVSSLVFMFSWFLFYFNAIMGGSVIVNILIAKYEGIPALSSSHVLTVRDGGEKDRERETFQLFRFTLKYGVGPMAEQREDKLSGDLPSRSSMDRLDVILFNLSPSSWHEEDGVGLTSSH